MISFSPLEFPLQKSLEMDDPDPKRGTRRSLVRTMESSTMLRRCIGGANCWLLAARWCGGATSGYERMQPFPQIRRLLKR